MNPLSIHHNLDTLLDAANHYRIDSSKENCVRLVSNYTNRCTRCSGGLKSKDHMYHHSLEDLFHGHWGHHLYGILWWVNPVNLPIASTHVLHQVVTLISEINHCLSTESFNTMIALPYCLCPYFRTILGLWMFLEWPPYVLIGFSLSKFETLDTLVTVLPF